MRLQDWEGSDSDSRKSIELYGPKNPLSLKPQYYLAQALLGQNHPEEALHIARYAYATCLETRDPSTEILSQFILRAKQGLWKTQETARLRGLNATLKQVEELLDEYTKSEMAALEARYSYGEIGEVGRNEEKAEMLAEAREKQEHIRLAFKSAGVDMAERVSPRTSGRRTGTKTHKRSSLTTWSTESPLRSCMIPSSHPPVSPTNV